MNRLLDGAAMPPLANIATPAQASAPTPGSKPYFQALARELELPTRGTKADLLARISTKQADQAGRRVRAPKVAAALPEIAQAPDPFDDALSRFEAFLGVR